MIGLAASPHPKVPIYNENGTGRDTYISFNDGGFAKYFAKIKPITRSDCPFEQSHYICKRPDLSLSKPINKYWTNGTGRDIYIYQGMLEDHSRQRNAVNLQNFLRSSYDTGMRSSRTIDAKRTSPSKFERKLLSRIFYGKCPGVKERLMSPKVKFLKNEKSINSSLNKSNSRSFEENGNKEESPKKEFIKENELETRFLSPQTTRRKIEPNALSGFDFEKKAFDIKMRNNKFDTIKYGDEENEQQPININYKYKTPKRKIIRLNHRYVKPEISKETTNLMNSVKQIFLYQNKARRSQELA